MISPGKQDNQDNGAVIQTDDLYIPLPSSRQGTSDAGRYPLSLFANDFPRTAISDSVRSPFSRCVLQLEMKSPQFWIRPPEWFAMSRSRMTAARNNLTTKSAIIALNLKRRLSSTLHLAYLNMLRVISPSSRSYHR